MFLFVFLLVVVEPLPILSLHALLLTRLYNASRHFFVKPIKKIR